MDVVERVELGGEPGGVEDDGKVVDTVTVTGDYLRADRPSWLSDAIVEPCGAGFLRLTQPG